MAQTPQTPHNPSKPATPSTSGSVNPKEHPPGAVTVHAPPLPTAPPAESHEQKPIMETGDAEQEAGKTAMEAWKKRQVAEEEAGRTALERNVKAKR